MEKSRDVLQMLKFIYGILTNNNTFSQSFSKAISEIPGY